jgi:CBS domain containing-hemolysin-like protein
MELSLFTASKIRLELDRKQGGLGSGIISAFSRRPGHFMATMIIGVNIAVVTFTIFASLLLGNIIVSIIPSATVNFIVQIIVVTLIVLLFADFLPKTLTTSNPNLFLKLFSVPAALFYYLLSPVTIISFWLARLMSRIFFGQRTDHTEQDNYIFKRIDPDLTTNDMAEAKEERQEENDSLRIFRNALDFSTVKARECMVPRTEIVALPVECTADELKHKFVESGHSKILLYRDNIDNMVGYFELKDILKEPLAIETRVRKLPVVPETMTASRVLKLLSEEKKSIALVVDEFGGTSGVITIEDVLEEIVGDIEDEHDISDLVEKQLSEKEYVFSGRLDIDYLNEEYDLSLPESDEYTTLAGLILYVHGNIPQQKENIRVGRHLFTVLRCTSTKVELLKLKSD